MAEQQFFPDIDGQEIGIPDYQGIGQTSGLMDDRVLAELLRLLPYNGTAVSKAVIATGNFGELNPTGAYAGGTVTSTENANGSIAVNPFRAIIGSRTTSATNPLQNWRDIRSSVFVGASALSTVIQLAANTSGSPRWDLVYVTVSVDVASGSQLRRVKNPSTQEVDAVTVTTVLLNPSTVQVVTGTPASTPAIPSLPSDSGGNYNIALAAVWVPNGFSSTSTVSQLQIRDQIPAAGILHTTTGAQSLRPAQGNNDQAGTYAANFPWTAGTAGNRPPMWLPPSWVGGEQLIVEVDDSSSSGSHANGSVVDASVDWTSRFFLTFLAGNSVGVAADFANNPAHGAAVFPLPLVSAANNGPFLRMGQSFVADGILVAGTTTAININPTLCPACATGSDVGIYIDTLGVMRWFSNGTPTQNKWFFWIFATSQFPNPLA